MASYVENRSTASQAEPIGLMTEGAAGIAVVALMVVALAGVSAGVLASIAAIVIGVGLMVQAFNSAAEEAKVEEAGVTAPNMGLSTQAATVGGEVMMDCVCGLTGIVLGILALVGINAAYLLPPALIVFGGSLLLSGAISLRPRTLAVTRPGTGTQIISYQGSPAAGGMKILTGVAAAVLGILSVVVASSGVLVLVGFLVVGAALLVASASFSGAALRLLATE
jgi:hypothetical protein